MHSTKHRTTHAPSQLTILLTLLILSITTLTACSDDSRRGHDSDRPTPCNFDDPQKDECPNNLICLDGVCIPQDTPDAELDTSPNNDQPDASSNNDQPDTSSNNDQPDAFEPAPDPDGTLYPLHDATHFIQSDFERKEAAFDNIIDQPADQAAALHLTASSSSSRIIGLEWTCAVRLRRINIHAPNDTTILAQADTTPSQGKSGTLNLMGKNNGISNSWRKLLTIDISETDSLITLLPEDLAGISPQVAIAVAFNQDDTSTAHIAEIESFGYCTTEPTPFTWDVTDWSCDTECHIQGNNQGERSRHVNCHRGNGYNTDDHICESQEPKPSTIGGPCQLTCNHTLKFIGYREFTYSNNSGWLHEGRETRRAGPLPRDVAHGNSIDDIQGKPCSILTPRDAPDQYFVGISCKNPDADSEQQYCAFRCE